MVNAFWMPNHNFGDHLNHYLLARLSKSGVVFTNIDEPVKKVVAIGSILGWCNEYAIAWGPGLASHSDCVNPATEIRAVRGPRSWKRAIECGCTAPKTFGDPALLMPRVYRPIQRKTHSVGLIPHYVDQRAVFERYSGEGREIRLIDVLDAPERVTDAIVSCDKVLSSSLHGIIVAHAYGVPAAWVSFSDKIGGDGMKYHDHFESVQCSVEGAATCSDFPSISEMLKRAAKQLKVTPQFNPAALLAAAPFELAI
ncbi:MAG: polysaccharide pyruvyl transferase family protein [Hyphomicrobium sp.]